MNKNTVQLETYPDMFIDDNNELVGNPGYDDQMRVFSIDRDWFIRYLEARFFETYDWDDSWQMYEAALKDHAVIDETMEER